MARALTPPIWWIFICMCNFWFRSNAAEVVSVGVNWETNSASHQLLPHTVVQMIKDNGFQKVKLFDSDSWKVSALAGSGIEVMISIPNRKLDFFSGRFHHAKHWVNKNVTKHMSDGVNIKYVAVGNEPFHRSYYGSYKKTIFPALQNIQKALDEAGLGDKIKATIPISENAIVSSNGNSSGGEFREDISDLMHQIIKFLDANKSPFVVNIYPFISLYQNQNQNQNFPLDFAFFDGQSNVTDDDINGTVRYTNVFDAKFDTLVWALKKAGVPDLKIIVGELGWPTDGDRNANPQLATRFYNGLVKKLANNTGTPLRHGPLEVYLFSLIDEDQKSVDRGPFERHWGIFRYDGVPKFPMDLTGQGDDEKYLVGAKGVRYLPLQWCVFKTEMSNKLNMSLVPDEMNYACTMGDCTSLVYGSSCDKLDLYGNISYAFNMFFQMQDQIAQACDFQGMAKLTKENASQGNCLFPVQIMNAGMRIESMTITCMVLLSLIVFALL
ncbi:Glycoside hydrolase [Macleaya cordata]|uniref:glucan endo-1,3-beta-D-glucosidase n=1 Tax=Macleaya cordata TaxID=56857 RepID=A0A200PYR1_MACCD|nr:Glycoside hydrolase [Macleaya cordata]